MLVLKYYWVQSNHSLPLAEDFDWLVQGEEESLLWLTQVCESLSMVFLSSGAHHTLHQIVVKEETKKEVWLLVWELDEEFERQEDFLLGVLLMALSLVFLWEQMMTSQVLRHKTEIQSGVIEEQIQDLVEEEDEVWLKKEEDDELYLKVRRNTRVLPFVVDEGLL